MEQETYELRSIGFVRRLDDGIRLEILEPFRPALRELERFSHVIVFLASEQARWINGQLLYVGGGWRMHQ